MTVASISQWSVEPLGDQLLRYANTPGIHMFTKEDNRKNLTIIGNSDQGAITLVFSFAGECSHLELPKWFWNIPLVRWIFSVWLKDDWV